MALFLCLFVMIAKDMALHSDRIARPQRRIELYGDTELVVESFCKDTGARGEAGAWL